MFKIFSRLICILIIVSFTLSESTPSPTVSTAGAAHIDNVASYVAGAAPYSPPTAYHYTEPNYGPQAYDNNYLIPYLNPAVALQNDAEEDADNSLASYQYLATILPYARMIYRALTKIGTLLLGGTLLLTLGGLLTTAVCSYTPLCTIQFNGLTGINRETVRSFMTPENLNAASTLVHEAIEKYQKVNKRR